MGASDNIEKGRSTFFIELQETSDTLINSTSKSLIILDELGRGTSTHDGTAIAFSTLEYLISTKKCFTLFVTHYPLLAELEQKYQTQIGNYHMSFLEDKDKGDNNAITFLYTLKKGVTKASYGRNVARLAGIPEDVIKQAADKSIEMKIKMDAARSSGRLREILHAADSIKDNSYFTTEPFKAIQRAILSQK